MRIARALAVFAFLLSCFGAVAAGDTVVILNSPWGCPYSPAETLNVFDDKVFDLSAADGRFYSRRGRAFGSEASYSQAEREEWIEKCAPEKEHSFKRFQKCFESEKNRSLKKK